MGWAATIHHPPYRLVNDHDMNMIKTITTLLRRGAATRPNCPHRPVIKEIGQKWSSPTINQRDRWLPTIILFIAVLQHSPIERTHGSRRIIRYNCPQLRRAAPGVVRPQTAIVRHAQSKQIGWGHQLHLCRRAGKSGADLRTVRSDNKDGGKPTGSVGDPRPGQALEGGRSPHHRTLLPRCHEKHRGLL